MDASRVHERNSDRYFDPAFIHGDLRPLYAAIARGTAEIGTSAITSWGHLKVPALTENELRRVGYARDEARELQGGGEAFVTTEGDEAARFWQFHGFYRRFYKNRGKGPRVDRSNAGIAGISRSGRSKKDTCGSCCGTKCRARGLESAVGGERGGR